MGLLKAGEVPLRGQPLKAREFHTSWRAEDAKPGSKNSAPYLDSPCPAGPGLSTPPKGIMWVVPGRLDLLTC